MKKFWYYLISSKKLTVTGAAFVLGSSYFLNNILGLLREVIIANKYGAERIADIFFASFKIPDLIFQFLILGALSAAFIPILVGYISKKDEETVQLISNSVLNFFLILASISAVVLFVLTPKLVPYLLPGFFRYPQEIGFNVYQVTVNTTRIMLLSPILFCISGVFGGILNSHKRFVAYSLAPIFYNLAIIFGALFLTKYFAIPVYGLALGVVIGAFLHMAVQFPSVFGTGFRYRPVLDFKQGAINRIIKLMIPRTLTIGVNQINILIDTVVASFFIGGISVLTYANDIQTVPSVIFGISVATAVFPYLAESYSQKDMTDFLKSFSWAARRILFFTLPAMVGIIVLRAQIVRLIFGFGAFTWESTFWTTRTLLFFILSLVAQSLVPLVVRAFYAFQDTKTPLYVGILVMIVNAVLAVVLPFKFHLGISGVALAFSLASFLNLFLLLSYLDKKIGSIDPDNKIFESFLKLGFISLIMGVLVHYSLYLFDLFVNTNRVRGLFLQTIGAVSFGALIYLFFAFLLKFEEFEAVKSFLKRLKPS